MDLLASLIIGSIKSIQDYAGEIEKKRRILISFSAALLFLFPSVSPHILFRGISDSNDNLPPMIKLSLLDIQETVWSFFDKVEHCGDPSISVQLANSYDIISAFISFLVRSFDEETSPSSYPASQIPPSLPFSATTLLLLRTQITEALTLTIKHLRNRFDALKLINSPDFNPNPMFQDVLTLSQLRTLALWLRDDDNEILRIRAAGIMDVILALYKPTPPLNSAIDFKSPILILLEGILATPKGPPTFLNLKGWSTLTQDLHHIINTPSHSTVSCGLDIIFILRTILETDGVPARAKSGWTEIITLATTAVNNHNNNHNNQSGSSEVPDPSLQIAIAQLAVDVLKKASAEERRRHQRAAESLLAMARRKMVADTAGGQEARDGFEDVVFGLEELSIGV